MLDFQRVREHLAATRYRWLITGSAGFIGSHLLEALLRLDQSVVSVDNLTTGHRHNLDSVRDIVGAQAWAQHTFIEGDVCDIELCRVACREVQFVLHEAALGSVPWSIDDPLAAHASNVTGFLNVLTAAKDAKVKRLVYASSSAVYGTEPAMPARESVIGEPLSPYAATKYANELYAGVFARCYGMDTIGLRYFNVFGPRQDPNGAYAAVIPKWLNAMLRQEQVVIYGDGETTRDFCYIQNVVQANLLAALSRTPEAANRTYNIAFGSATSLNELFNQMRRLVGECARVTPRPQPVHQPERVGDVRHSLADIGKARALLNYQPAYSLLDGLRETVTWFADRAGIPAQASVQSPGD